MPLVSPAGTYRYRISGHARARECEQHPPKVLYPSMLPKRVRGARGLVTKSCNNNTRVYIVHVSMMMAQMTCNV